MALLGSYLELRARVTGISVSMAPAAPVARPPTSPHHLAARTPQFLRNPVRGIVAFCIPVHFYTIVLGL